MVLGYCTDADDPDAEFPRHTMRFGFPRNDDAIYWLRPQSFDQAVVGTRISFVAEVGENAVPPQTRSHHRQAHSKYLHIRPNHLETLDLNPNPYFDCN